MKIENLGVLLLFVSNRVKRFGYKSQAEKEYWANSYKMAGFSGMVPIATIFVNFYQVFQSGSIKYEILIIQGIYGVFFAWAGMILLYKGAEELK